jgi:hypothetical protein
VPSPTIDPATGNVTGVIRWADIPFAGVTVILCTDWLYTCKGKPYTGITDARGGFSITGIDPGNYQFITLLPGEKDETRVLDGPLPAVITVTGGKAVNLAPVNVCKQDLVILSPTINGGSVTFAWKPYSGATGYYAGLSGISNGGEYGPGHTKSTSFSVALPPGTYQLEVSAYGQGCAETMITFIMQ